MGRRLFVQLYKENKGDSITLPINPESIEVIKGKTIKTHDILNYGEVAVAGMPKLESISLPSILPADTSYFALLSTLVEKLEYKTYTQDRALKKLDEWVLSQQPIRLIVSQYINKEYLVSQYREVINENTGDINYTIDLTEYKNPTKPTGALLNNKLKIAKIAKDTVEGKITNSKILPILSQRPIGKFISKQIVAQNGMTLYKLAKLTYGSIAAKSNALANLNSIVNKNKDIGGEIIEMLPVNYDFSKEGLL